MAAFIAFYDANVLYPAELRNFLMHLALTGIFRAKWSDAVHEEWISNLLKNRPDLTRQKLERTRQLMDRAALDALAVKQGLLDNPPEPEAEQPAVPEGTLLVNACEQFLRDTKATKSEATYLTYGTQLKWFLQRTTKITAGGS